MNTTKPYAGRRRGVAVPLVPPPEERVRDLVSFAGERAQCARCLFPVWRVRGPGGALREVDRDGVNHRLSCPWRAAL